MAEISKNFNFNKVGLFLILLFSLFYSINAVILVPGVDADINYSDSPRGIWWSSMNIYARTSINPGDIIQISYTASNSTDDELYPLFLKLKNVDTIICVNELLDNISPYTSYPVCFYNSVYTNSGFNYSVREAQSLYTTKEYDIIWGKKYQYIVDTINLSSYSYNLSNISLISNTLKINATYYNQSYSTVWSSASGLNLAYNSLIYGACGSANNGYYPKVDGTEVHFCTARNGSYLSYVDGGTGYSGYSYWGSNGWCHSNNFGSTPHIASSITCQKDYGIYKGSFIQNLSYKPKEKISKVIISSSGYPDGGNISSGLNIGGTNYSFSSNQIIFPTSINPGSDLYFKAEFNRSNGTQYPYINLIDLNLKIYKTYNYTIIRESDDYITGINFVPFQTSSNYLSFLTIDAITGTNLWNDLNNFDSPVLTNNLNSYLQIGSNNIIINQTNENGGFWMFFEGFYNTPPSLTTNPTISPTTITKASTVTASEGNYYDFNGDPKSAVEFRWYKNGALSGYTSSSINLASSTYVKGDIIKVEQRVYDGTDWSNWYSSNQYTLQNSLPSVTLPSLSSSSLIITDTVSCVLGSYSDADGDIQSSSSIKWYKNGVVVSGQTSSTIDLDVAGYNGGNTVKCSHEVGDGTSTSGIIYSNEATIGNSAPTLTTNPSISPAPVYKTYTVTCNAGTYNDLNGNPQSSVQFRWYENGILTGYSTQILNLTNSNFSRADGIRCEQRVSDGIDWSSWYSSSELTLQNTAPTATNPSLSKSELYITDSVSCIAGTYSDVDSDPISSNEFRWYKNGVDTGITTSSINLASSSFSKGDMVKCSYKVNDGYTWSIPYYSSEIIIWNSKPTVTNPSLNESILYLSKTVTCNAGVFNDPDSDTISSSEFKWYKNGVLTGFTTGSLNLKLNGFAKGNAVKCSYRVSDGALWSDLVNSSELNIINEPPILNSNPLLSLTIIYKNSTISCNSGNYTDNDGDIKSTSEFRWYKNGVLTGYSSQSLTLNTTTYSKGDLIKCEERVSDGTNWSNYYSSNELSIQNNKPSISVPELNKFTIYKIDDVTCNLGIYSDVDGDLQQDSQIKWYKNGVDTGLTTPSINLEIAGFKKGDKIKCLNKVYDGIEWSNWVNSTEITLSNILPVLNSNSTISPTIIYKSSTITCSPGTYFDGDNDLLDTIQYDWHKNGLSQDINSATLNITTSSFIKSNNISCLARVYDGQNWSSWYQTSSYQIQDTAPTFNVQVSSQLISSPSDINCNYISYNDIDGDSVSSFTIEWYEGAIQKYQVSNINSLVLPSSSIKTEVNYTCKITLNQGLNQFNLTNWTMMTNIAPNKPSITQLNSLYTVGLISQANFCLGTDNNNDNLTYDLEYSTDNASWYSISTSGSTGVLNWDTTGKSGTHYIRCRTNDTKAVSSYSDLTFIELKDYSEGTDFIVNYDSSNKGTWWSTITISAINPLSFNKNIYLDNTVSGSVDNVSPVIVKLVGNDTILCVHEDIAYIYNKPACLFSTKFSKTRFTLQDIISTSSNKSYELVSGKKIINGSSPFNVTRKSVEPVTDVLISPFKSNSQWPKFIIIKDGAAQNLFYDLYELDVLTSTANLNTYLLAGTTNKIQTEQFDAYGGYWFTFKGNYDNLPYLSPGPSLNVTGTIGINESVYCNAGTYYDINGDQQTAVFFDWYRNNITLNKSTQGLDLNSISITKNDIIKCSQIVSNINAQSDIYYSNEIIVGGSSPTGNISLNPSIPQQDQSVTCSISNINDTDGDNVSITLKWVSGITVLSSINSTNSALNLTLNSSQINTQQQYDCIATLNDGLINFNLTKSFGIGNVVPTVIRGLSIDTNYAYDGLITTDITCLGSDANENDSLTTHYQYSTDKITWVPINMNSENSFRWDVSSLSEGSYYLRCYVNDGILNSSFKELDGNISVKKYVKSLTVNADHFYSMKFSISTGAAIQTDQYNNGATGYLAGDLKTNNPTKILTYLPEKFDGVRKFKGFEIKPNLAYIRGSSVASGIAKNYDILVYQVNTIGEIPTGDPLTVLYDVNFNVGYRNKFDFNIIPSKDKYVAILICNNVNEITNTCIGDNNDLTDSIIVKGSSTGSYLAKVDQGTDAFTTAYDLDIGFDWERKPLEKVKSKVEINFADNMKPMVIVKRGNGEKVCGVKLISVKEGIPLCIEDISSTEYYINTEYLEAGTIYDILGGGSIQFLEKGTKELSITKNTAISEAVRMNIAGVEYMNSFISTPFLLFNSNNFWNNAGEFSTVISTNPLNNVLMEGENKLVFSSESAGEILFWMEPIYSNLIVTHGTILEPIENGIQTLPISFTTKLTVDLEDSYCAFLRDGVLITKSTISGSLGLYTCEPSLALTDFAGVYQLQVYVKDINGFTDNYESTITYRELKALTVETINFGAVETLDNSSNKILKAKSLIKNTGNTKITKITYKAKLDKFWDNDGEESFSYLKRLYYANEEKQLETLRYRNEFLTSEENNMFFNLIDLDPGRAIEVNFELNMTNINVPINVYTTEWEVIYE